jgi:2-haloalkanoic acid dehalogenase type II
MAGYPVMETPAHRDVATLKAVFLDFFGTVIEEDDLPVAAICGRIAQAADHPLAPGEIGHYWALQFRALCDESYGPHYRLQKEIERLALQRVLGHFHVALDPAQLCEQLFAYWRRPRLFPEVREVLERCPRPVYLVSNMDNAELEAALIHLGLCFAGVITSEDCRAYKPHPAIFAQALQQAGLPAGHILHVGDSLHCDVGGARRIGLPVLWINRQHRSLPPGAQPPAFEAEDLNGLLRVLEGLR